MDGGSRMPHRKHGVLRLFENGPELRNMGHFDPSDQSGDRSNVYISAIDPTYHGPYSEGRYTLRHQPVQRDAQYRVQHGNILRDDFAGAPVAVPSGPSCRQHFALQSAVAAGAEPSWGNVRAARLRPGGLHAPSSWIPVWLVATASHIAQLHRRVSCDGMAIPADRPFGAAHAEAEAGSRSFNGSALEPAGPCLASTLSTHVASARSFDVRQSELAQIGFQLRSRLSKFRKLPLPGRPRRIIAHGSIMKQRSDYHANNESDSNQCARGRFRSSGSGDSRAKHRRAVNQGAGMRCLSRRSDS